MKFIGTVFPGTEADPALSRGVVWLKEPGNAGIGRRLSRRRTRSREIPEVQFLSVGQMPPEDEFLGLMLRSTCFVMGLEDKAAMEKIGNRFSVPVAPKSKLKQCFMRSLLARNIA
jgi:hypothetical protein